MCGSLSDIGDSQPLCEHTDDWEPLRMLRSNRVRAYAIQDRTPRKSAPLPGVHAGREIVLQETWLHLNTKVNSDPFFDFRICALVSND
jgi:hypothetical protein